MIQSFCGISFQERDFFLSFIVMMSLDAHVWLLQHRKTSPTLWSFGLSTHSSCFFTWHLLSITFICKIPVEGQRKLVWLKGSNPAGLGRGEVHVLSFHSIAHLHSDTQKQIDVMLRFYLHNRAWFAFRIFSSGSKLYMLQTLSFMQTSCQNLACDSFNATVQVSCLVLAFIEFKSLLLLSAKICLHLRTLRPCWPPLLRG